MDCNFLFMCAGYYNYAEGYTPKFAGMERFKGRIVHPQKWTEDIDYAGKRVVVIGSGATAVTLVPEMAKQAAHVTMLQRSPTYTSSRARPRTRSPTGCAAACPRSLAHGADALEERAARHVLLQAVPAQAGARQGAHHGRGAKALGPDYDVDTHFTPRYNPWDQRLCLVPDADLFKAIRDGNARRWSPTRSRASPKRASGCARATSCRRTWWSPRPASSCRCLGGMNVDVDGARVDPAKT